MHITKMIYPKIETRDPRLLLGPETRDPSQKWEPRSYRWEPKTQDLGSLSYVKQKTGSGTQGPGPKTLGTCQWQKLRPRILIRTRKKERTAWIFSGRTTGFKKSFYLILGTKVWVVRLIKNMHKWELWIRNSRTDKVKIY